MLLGSIPQRCPKLHSMSNACRKQLRVVFSHMVSPRCAPDEGPEHATEPHSIFQTLHSPDWILHSLKQMATARPIRPSNSLHSRHTAAAAELIDQPGYLFCTCCENAPSPSTVSTCFAHVLNVHFNPHAKHRLLKFLLS